MALMMERITGWLRTGKEQNTRDGQSTHLYYLSQSVGTPSVDVTSPRRVKVGESNSDSLNKLQLPINTVDFCPRMQNATYHVLKAVCNVSTRITFLEYYHDTDTKTLMIIFLH